MSLEIINKKQLLMFLKNKVTYENHITDKNIGKTVWPSIYCCLCISLNETDSTLMSLHRHLALKEICMLLGKKHSY